MSDLIKLYCTSCGAEINIDSSREFCFCQYCGTKMLIPGERKFIHIDGKVEHVNRTVDETSKTIAEKLSPKQIERLEKKRMQSDIAKSDNMPLIVSLIVFLTFVLLSVLSKFGLF